MNKELVKIVYSSLLDAIYSNNNEYILDKLSRIYTIIYNNNIEEINDIKRLGVINND